MATRKAPTKKTRPDDPRECGDDLDRFAHHFAAALEIARKRPALYRLFNELIDAWALWESNLPRFGFSEEFIALAARYAEKMPKRRKEERRPTRRRK